MTAGSLIRERRVAAGMTQSELATRLGTSQPAIARLERPGSNPRVGTLDRALRETGHKLKMSAEPLLESVDESLIVANLRLSPRERLATFSASHRNLRGLLERARPAP
jgi:transcriptional regulator with XRE-family HTH domain